MTSCPPPECSLSPTLGHKFKWLGMERVANPVHCPLRPGFRCISPQPQPQPSVPGGTRVQVGRFLTLGWEIVLPFFSGPESGFLLYSTCEFSSLIHGGFNVALFPKVAEGEIELKFQEPKLPYTLGVRLGWALPLPSCMVYVFYKMWTKSYTLY